MILEASGVKGGLVVHLSCGDGRLTAELRPNDRYQVHGLDRDAAFYRLNFFDRDEGDLLDQYNVRLRPEASYRKGMFSLFARADLRLRYDYQGWDEQSRLFEGYASLKPSPSLGRATSIDSAIRSISCS